MPAAVAAVVLTVIADVALAVAAVGLGTASGQETPLRSEARPGSLARYVPKQDNLFFYLEFDGLDAHQAAWKDSSARRTWRWHEPN